MAVEALSWVLLVVVSRRAWLLPVAPLRSREGLQEGCAWVEDQDLRVKGGAAGPAMKSGFSGV